MTTQEEQELIELVVYQARDLIGTLRCSGFSHSQIVNAISERNGFEEYQKHPDDSLIGRIGITIHAILDGGGETDDGKVTPVVRDRNELIDRVRFKLLELYS